MVIGTIVHELRHIVGSNSFQSVCQLARSACQSLYDDYHREAGANKWFEQLPALVRKHIHTMYIDALNANHSCIIQHARQQA